MRRPTSFTVFGTLNLLFGIFGILGMISYAAMLFLPQQEILNNPVIEIIQRNPAYLLYLKFSVISGAVIGGILIFSGIGLLAFRPWGRFLAIVYAFFGIITSMIGFAVSYFYFMPMLMEKAAQMPDGPEKSGMIGGAVGGIIGGVLAFVYALLLLWFMHRDSVIEALRLRNVPGQPDFSAMYRM